MNHFDELQQKIFNALVHYAQVLAEETKKTTELSDTCAILASEKALLKEKVKELTDTIVKLSVRIDELTAEKKEILHG
jgi:predicted nuclease with TOPRIM domain